VRKALGRFVTVSREGKREFYQIKFEKIPKFSGACGFIGHSHLECGTGEHIEANLKWGDFLKADWETWRGRSAPGVRGGGGRGRGARGGFSGDQAGRGCGRDQRSGRDITISWSHNALPYEKVDEQEEDPLADTDSSPIKPRDVDMSDRESSESGAKRRLDLNNAGDEESLVEKENVLAVVVTDGTISPMTRMDVDKENERLKHSKKAGANSPSLGSAGSHEESVRSQ
jgi:hypothetical protein